jgi:hypothetical protein
MESAWFTAGVVSLESHDGKKTGEKLAAVAIFRFFL